jgi:hypothetical protein
MMEILMDKIFTILKMKANYSELSRFYGVSRQTISQYNVNANLIIITFANEYFKDISFNNNNIRFF